MTEEKLKAKSNAILDKLEEEGFDLGDWSIEDAHNNGFIDGYHEGFKDCAKSRLNVTTISDCPIKDDWHYVKDGKYPTDEKDVEVLYQDCDKINVYNCVYDIHAENWLYYNLDDMMLELFPFNVIAWKEIVLPKESE